MKQHIIPEVYLKQFLNVNKKLYSIKTKVSYKQSLSEFTAAQVCYEIDYYEYGNTNSLYRKVDPLFIENKVNKIFENRYEKYIKFFNKRPSSITYKDAYHFAEILISFKQRNPMFKAIFDKIDIKEEFNKRVDLLISNEDIMQNLIKNSGPNTTKDSFIERLRMTVDQVSSDEHTPRRIQLDSILLLATGGDDVTKEVINLILHGHWFIFESKSSIPFITSDNPGFTFDDDERVHNLNFKDCVSFQFPLTPNKMFCSFLPLNGSPIDDKKVIGYRECNCELTKMINKATLQTSYKRILSNDKNEMQYMLDTYFKKVSIKNILH